MTTTFENARAGDRVWDFNLLRGEIIRIVEPDQYNRENRTLLVRFANNNDVWFRADGVACGRVVCTLFWDEIKFEPPPQPKRKVKKIIKVFRLPEHDAWSVRPTLYDSLNQAKNEELVGTDYAYAEIEIEE